MADLHFVDFASIPSPVRKEKQFRLPDDFSEFDFTTGALSRTSAISSFHITDWPLFDDPPNVLHDESKARNFNISARRGRNRRLLAAVMQKERSLVE